MTQSTIERHPLDKHNLQFEEIDKDSRIVKIKKEMVELTELVKSKNLSREKLQADADVQKYGALKKSLKALRKELLNANK